jgi:hypothetical protein
MHLRAQDLQLFSLRKNPAMEGFLELLLPLGDPQGDKFVRMKIFENPIIVDEMAKWNAIPFAQACRHNLRFWAKANLG